MMEVNSNNNKQSLIGIRGWLILVAIGIFYKIASSAIYMASSFPELLELKQFFGSSESEYYSPGFWYFNLFESGFNVLFFFGFLYLAYLFFTKNYRTPTVFIIVNLLLIVFLLVDTFGFSLMDKSEPIFSLLDKNDIKAINADSYKEIIRQVIYSLIWIPYFLKSVRVKNTFVRGKDKTKTIESGMIAGN